MGRRSFVVAVLALATLACKKEAPPAPAAAAPAAAAPAANVQVLRGKVLEKIDVSQYSYLRLSTASGETWAAVQKTDKKVGDEVGVVNAFPMQGFESKELNRKFDVVYFGSLATGPGAEATAAAPAAAPKGAPSAVPASAGGPPADMAAQHQMVATGPSDVKVEKVAKASGADGRTVAEVWAQRQKLAGKQVAVRGKVVKFTPVMGKNFIHLRDGSGSADKKDNDVTVTTNDPAAVGEVITAKGTVVVDRDFGSGYAYPVLLDDAKVTK